MEEVNRDYLLKVTQQILSKGVEPCDIQYILDRCLDAAKRGLYFTAIKKAELPSTCVKDEQYYNDLMNMIKVRDMSIRLESDYELRGKFIIGWM